MPDLTREEILAAQARLKAADERRGGHFSTTQDSIVDGLALAALALRQMEEIERLTRERDVVVEQAQVAYEVFRKEGARLEADRDHWKGVVVEVQSDAAVAESNCDRLTADLAAARAKLDRVEALVDKWYADFGNVGVVVALRTALRGQEGAKDA